MTTDRTGSHDAHDRFLEPRLLNQIEAFIHSHWEETVRFNQKDEGTLLGLPFPYTVPSCKGVFQELYYWDTYFTCLGLLHSGRVDLAVANTRNLLAQVERHGYVPNGNRTYYMTRSQPPYLAALVERVAAAQGEAGGVLLREALPTLRREYRFWMERRATPTGLSRYGHLADRAGLLAFAPEIAARIGLTLPETTEETEAALPVIAHTMAECESGWDFNPRFEHRCEDFCPVDLNSLLYGYERCFAVHGDGAERTEAAAAAERRRALLVERCWDEERGGFFDYDFRTGRRSAIVSAAAFQPLWAGLATTEQAAATVERILPLLERPFGLAACVPVAGGRRCQWDYPNGWACLHHIAYEGLRRYGYADAARRIAGKYLAVVGRVFAETGELWEKYNVEEGSRRTGDEAGYSVSSRDEGGLADTVPPLMGWTAGVFLDALALYRRS